MSGNARRPENCPFRLLGGEGRFGCALASCILGLAEGTFSPVDQRACEACCRHRLPDGPRLNSVVAALVFAAAERARQALASDDARQCELEHARQFAGRWLATFDERGNPLPSLESSMPDVDRPAGPHSIFDGAAALDRAVVDRRPMRIGLVGAAVGFGLAHQNRDIARHLAIDRWLIRGRAPHDSLPAWCRLDAVGRDLSPMEMEAWLDGLDAILFVERPVFAGLTRMARRLGVAVACVPNWEWLSPGMEWLDDVQVMLCPGRHTARMLLDWKRRFGFDWHVASIPWPIDSERFAYRQRRVCERFVYIHGSGGVEAVRRDGSESCFRRKGLAVLIEAARRVPEVPLIVYAFRQDVPDPPPNVELRMPPDDNRLLYGDGDVCVQPSHWEGLGLPLLECQAAGLPLITTDAPPMNEHRPLAVVPAELEAVSLPGKLCIPSARIEPRDLAAVLKSVHGRRIGWASRRARRFVERHHSWKAAGRRIRETIDYHSSRRRAFPAPDQS